MVDNYNPFKTSLHAVVSVLDDQHYRQVEQLWQELEDELGIRRIMDEASLPHFSYHGGSEYDFDEVERALKAIAFRARPFRVRTSGLGIFNVAAPIVYVPVARNPHLNRIHQMVWHKIGRPMANPTNYYNPDMWLPHITLAYRDTSRENLPKIVHYLSRYSYLWEIEVNNIAFMHHSGTDSELKFQFEFCGDQIAVG